MKHIREMLQKEGSSLRILYVEDELDTQKKVAQIFGLFFKEVICAINGEEALAYYAKESFDLVITDLTMPKIDGVTVIKEIKQKNLQQRIIVITAHNSSENLLDTINLQVDGFLLKPLSVDKLIYLLYKVAHELYLEKRLCSITHFNESAPEYEVNAFRARILEENFAVSVMMTIKNLKRLRITFGEELVEHLWSVSREYFQMHKPAGAQLFAWSEEFFVYHFEHGDKMAVYEVMKKFVSNFGTAYITYEETPFPVIYSAVIVSGKGLELMSKMNHIHDVYDRSTKPILSLYEFPDDLEHRKEALYWVSKTVNALQNDRITPFYQPIIALNRMEIYGFEVLAHIEENGTYVEPRLFIELIEKAGIVDQISTQVYQKAFAVLGAETPFALHLNVSEEELRNSLLHTRLSEKVTYFGIEVSRVVLEINFHAAYLKEESIKQTLKALKKEGYQILIENYAENQMDMYALKELMPDIVKIEQHFLHCAFEDINVHKILEALIVFLKSLSIKVAAIGIEDENMLRFVKMMEFDVVQGYYLGAPALEAHY